MTAAGAGRDGGPFANRWARRGLIFLFWTALGALNAASAVIDTARVDPLKPAWKPIVWEMSSLYTIGALCPLLVWLTRRFNFARAVRTRSLLIHLAALPAFSLLHTGGMVALRKLAYAFMGLSYSFSGQSLTQGLLYEFYKDIALYWVIVFLALGFQFYKQNRRRELRAAQLETRLAEAQLNNLKGQINPHFLFNTLNMISATMYDDVKKADRLIMRLSDLLRMALDQSKQNLIPLGDELAFLDNYLEIIRVRFEDQLTVSVEVDEAARSALTPSLILQPLVENAVVHGMADRVAGGAIEVTAAIAGDRLRLTVSDNGPGLPADYDLARRQGVGLRNTAERCARLLGDDARLTLINREGGGAQAILDLPCRKVRETDHG